MNEEESRCPLGRGCSIHPQLCRLKAECESNSGKFRIDRWVEERMAVHQSLRSPVSIYLIQQLNSRGHTFEPEWYYEHIALILDELVWILVKCPKVTGKDLGKFVEMAVEHHLTELNLR